MVPSTPAEESGPADSGAGPGQMADPTEAESSAAGWVGGSGWAEPRPRAGPTPKWWSATPADPQPPIMPARAYLEVLSVYALFFGAPIGLAAASLAGALPARTRAGWGLAGPSAVEELTTAALAVLVVVLLAGRRGVGLRSLGFRAPVRRYGAVLGTSVRTAAWASAGLVAGAAVTAALRTGTNDLHVATVADLVLGASAAVNAGFVEEVVVLAFLVTTLEQARRPLPEIVVVALVLRAGYHIYYGPGVAGIFVWAAMFLWLYRRTRSIWPLIAVHISWDLLVTIEVLYRPASIALALLLVALLLAAPLTWLADRTRPRVLYRPG